MITKAQVRELYDGDGAAGRRFRYGLIGFDLVTVVFLVTTSFLPREPWIERVDLVVGLFILADFAARMWISPHRWRDLVHPVGLADLAVIVSLLAPVAGEGFAFLRVVRTLRLVRSYQLLLRMRQDFEFVRHNRAALQSALDLFVFTFVMTALVYETQYRHNPGIKNYADALYFTVTSLTTTGYGDITLPGVWGRLLSVLIMVFGVTLFVRLAQALFRPRKVDFECPDCGLLHHDPDAVHCKHCGLRLRIPNESLD